MKPPAELPSFFIAIAYSFAREAKLDPDDLIAWVYRRKKCPLRIALQLVDVFAPVMRLEHLDVDLTHVPNDAKVRYGMQLTIDRRGRKVGRPLDSDHLFPRWLRDQNITVTEWADTHTDPDTGKPYKRERVKSWYAEGTGGRPAPRHAVDIIAVESTPPKGKPAVPATLKTWKNGIRE